MIRCTGIVSSVKGGSVRNVGSVHASPVQGSGILEYGKYVLAVLMNFRLEAWVIQDTIE